ncbi:hypothetical protein CE91St43_00140 [Oscillospiraceae bacterium]|nr:hypothetical protein CE91St43_00140 [Oscillospiraceae bacterium]
MENPAFLRANARRLRKEATKEERRLWYDFLKGYPVQFRRQQVFRSYIVDFFCHKAALAIELDGGQHYEGDGPEDDRARTRWLEETCHIKVLRFTNLEISQNFEGVCQAIDLSIREWLPSSATALGGL